MTRKFAADDGNLNTGSILVSRNRKYSDINLLFAPKPGSKDIYLSKDAAAVKQSVKSIILTNFYERPFQPFVGANLRALLFEQISPFLINQIEDTISAAVANYEPRARILDVRATAREDANSIDVTLEFQVVSTRETVTLNVALERVR